MKCELNAACINPDPHSIGHCYGADGKPIFDFDGIRISLGRKDDKGKRRFSLLPAMAVRTVVDVLMFGAAKYGDENWRKVKDPHTRYYDALMRHVDAWRDGETLDTDSGLPHLAHAVCCLLFMIELK